MEDQDLSLPDATRAQVVALAQAVIAVAVAFGVPISDQQSVALMALAAVIGTVLIGADAAIRRERARNADKLRPKATFTQTTTEGDTESTATVAVPMPQGGGQEDMNARLLELAKSFELVAKFIEAERARAAPTPAPAAAPASANGSTKREPAKRRRAPAAS